MECLPPSNEGESPSNQIKSNQIKILKAKKDLQRAHKRLGRFPSEQNVVNYKKFQVLYRKAVKMWRISEGMRRDQRLHTIMTDKPADIFKFMRSHKPSSREILELIVGNRVYSGDDIPDGYYESLHFGSK